MASKMLSDRDMKDKKEEGADETFIDISVVTPFLCGRAKKFAKVRSKKKPHARAKPMSHNGLKESEQYSSEIENSKIGWMDNFESFNEKKSNEESNNEVNKNEENEVFNFYNASFPPVDSHISSTESPKWKAVNGGFDKKSRIIISRSTDSSSTTPLETNSTESSAKCETVQNQEPGSSKSPTEEKMLTKSKISTEGKTVERKELERKRKQKMDLDAMRLAIDPGSLGITSFTSLNPSPSVSTCVFDLLGYCEEVPKLAESPCKTKIGVIGCGPMAQEIINILFKNKFSFNVWNRTPEKYQNLPSSVQICKSPCSLIRKSDFVISCVADEEAVLKIVFGNNGILEGIGKSKKKKGYIEMSSIPSSFIEVISEEIIGHGANYLDGQIQGTRMAVRFGSAVIVASGSRTLFEAARPFFTALTHHVFYLNSRAGTASNASTIVTSIQAIGLACLAEVITAMREMKEDPRLFTQLLKGAFGMPVFHAIACMMRKNIGIEEDPLMIPLGHLYKNLNNILELGYKHKVPNMAAASASEAYKVKIRKFSKYHDVSVLANQIDPYPCSQPKKRLFHDI